jgi:hypothetical protein
MGYNFHDPETRPKPFDIVWCKKPLRGEGVKPGPVARPVLVLGTKLYELNGKEFATVAVQYGGDFETKHIPGNFLVSETEFRTLGLHKPTLFRMDLGNRAECMWAQEYFQPQPYVVGRGILAGSLSADQQKRVISCLTAKGLSFPIP